MSQYKMVTYNGMKCRLYKDYMAEVDGYLYPEFRDDGYVVVTKRRNEND